MGQVGKVHGSTNLFGTEDQIVLSLVSRKSNSGIGEVSPSHHLEDPLQQMPTCWAGEESWGGNGGSRLSLEDLVIGGISSPDQLFSFR